MDDTKEPGLDIPMPAKGTKPMRREANPWLSGRLTGAMTEYRTVQDFGGPKGWPPSAPASATHTTSATDPGTPSTSDAMLGVAAAIGKGTSPRKNPAK